MADWVRPVADSITQVDEGIYTGLAQTKSRFLDTTMPALTNAADHSKIWFGIAGVLALTRSRRAKRAALRGVLTIGATSFLANQVAKRLTPRERPLATTVPQARWPRHRPTSASFPSGHSASAAAFATAVGMEIPALSIPLGGLAGLVGLSRVVTGTHYPSDVAAGWLLGAAVAQVGGKLVPPAQPPSPVDKPPVIHLDPRPTGTGVVLVVNPASHSGQGEKVLKAVTSDLPDVEVVELSKDDDVEAVMRAAAQRAQVLGVAGGDGTVRTAAAAARDADVPLAVFPAGTFNHFAKDAGAYPLADAIAAVKAGTAAKVDLAYLNDELFLNTASIGAYTDFVEVRERFEGRFGKPVAALYAGVRTLFKDNAITVRVDDRTSEIDLLFLGNSTYQPRGFAPSFREQLDDGVADLRMLDATSFGKTLVTLGALLTGQLARTNRYHEIHAPTLKIEVLRGGPVRIARDGELGEEAHVLHVRVDRRALTVFRSDRAF